VHAMEDIPSHSPHPHSPPQHKGQGHHSHTTHFLPLSSSPSLCTQQTKQRTDGRMTCLTLNNEKEGGGKPSNTPDVGIQPRVHTQAINHSLPLSLSHSHCNITTMNHHRIKHITWTVGINTSRGERTRKTMQCSALLRSTPPSPPFSSILLHLR